MATKLDNFDYDLLENYYLKNLSTNDFWLFASHDFRETRDISRNTDQTALESLEKTIFGIQYEIEDFSFMIPASLWQQNTVYVQYDDQSVLEDTNFYITVEPDGESGDYHIYKCISNNNGSVSVEVPIFNSSIEDGLYYLSDGYVWKYMTSIPFILFRKFSARGLIPVIRNQSVEDIANEGIYNIVVENPNQNSGYDRITGSINSIDISNGLTKIFIRNIFSETNRVIPVFEVPNIFANRTIYVEKSNQSQSIGAVELTIIESDVQGDLPFVVVETPDGFSFSAGDLIEILPRVIIEGTGTGASAIAGFSTDNQRIDKIRMLSFGSDYRSATARIVDPLSFDPDNPSRRDLRCLIRPIISPNGGHGANVLSELKSRHICLSKLVKSEAVNNVVSTGTYSKANLVKEPSFDFSFEEKTFDNRISMILDVLPSDLEVGSVVTQGPIRAKVHEIDEQENKIFLAEYEGPYSNVFSVEDPLFFRNISYQINSIDFSPYVPRTGNVLSVVDFTPIERDETKSEQIRIILDF